MKQKMDDLRDSEVAKNTTLLLKTAAIYLITHAAAGITDVLTVVGYALLSVSVDHVPHFTVDRIFAIWAVRVRLLYCANLILFLDGFDIRWT